MFMSTAASIHSDPHGLVPGRFGRRLGWLVKQNAAKTRRVFGGSEEGSDV
jgi:hypothetical protein